MTSGERRPWFSKRASCIGQNLPLSRANSAAWAAGMALGCWLRGKGMLAERTFVAFF